MDRGSSDQGVPGPTSLAAIMLRLLEGRSTILTMYGEDVGVIIPIAEYQRLTELARQAAPFALIGLIRPKGGSHEAP